MIPSTMRALCSVAAATLLTVSAAGAADTNPAPTYLGDVKPILAENCVSCHRPEGANLGGMIAPMSLTTYAEVRPWAKAIARAAMNRDMPPWDAADVHRGQFRNERTLDAEEITTLASWAKNGAARGEGEDTAPEFGTAHDGWSIGEPDLVVTMPEPFLVDDEVEDLYVDIAVPLPDDVTADRWMEAIEFKAGSSAVHHIIAYAVPEGKHKLSPGAMLGGIAPGSDPDRFPEGYGRLLTAGSKIVFEMHYHKEPGDGTAVADRSSMAIKFHDRPVDHAVMVDGIANWDFEIPAGAAEHQVHAEHTFANDVEILSFTPHMHLRGAAARYVAFYPDGREELLLDVPRYDFNWQTMYYLHQPKVVPQGTRIEVTMTFDNSADNPSNPDSTVAVRYGEPTTDEMAIGFMNYTNAEPGDFEVEVLTDYEALFGGSTTDSGL